MPRWIVALKSPRGLKLIVTGFSASELALQLSCRTGELTEMSLMHVIEVIGLSLVCLYVALVLMEFAFSAIFFISEGLKDVEVVDIQGLQLVVNRMKVALFGA